MKDRRIFLHVGLQKTASTYLQEIVFPRLDGIAFIGRPYTQENRAFNSLQYADTALYDESIVREEFSEIERELDTNQPLLISDELFSGYSFYNLINRGFVAERLSHIVPGAEVILFLRNQVDLIMSLYNQYVKMGWVSGQLDETFLHKPGHGFTHHEWIAGKREWNLQNRFISHQSVFSTEHFRFSKLYNLYSRLFANVHVFLYEDFKNNPDDSLRRLASIMDVELPKWLLPQKKDRRGVVNQGLGIAQLNRKLLQNKMTPVFGSKISGALAGIVSVFSSDHRNENKNFVRSTVIQAGLFGDNRELDANLHLGMSRYAQKYFGGSS